MTDLEELQLRGRLRGLEHALAFALTFLFELRVDANTQAGQPRQKLSPFTASFAADLTGTAVEAEGPLAYRAAMLDALKELGRAVHENAQNIDQLQGRG